MLDALRATGGNVVHAARALGLAHRTMRKYIVKLGLDPDLEVIRKAKAGEKA